MLARIDHLVYTAPSLEEGMDVIQQILGIRPLPGGSHPQWGTCNALLSLGRDQYLEVIARDPNLPMPSRGMPQVFASRESPRLSTWAAKAKHLHEVRAMASRAGIELGEVVPGVRKHVSGREFHWQLTDPFSQILQGVFPFFIDWGDSPHPSSLVAQAGVIQDLILIHPKPSIPSKVLAGLGLEIEVRCGSVPGLMATIRTPQGSVVLQ